MFESSTIMRWDPYVLARGSEFSTFWRTHLAAKPRKLLFLIGRGYDPRALDAIEAIVEAGGSGDIWVLAFDNGLEDSIQRIELTNENMTRVAALFDNSATQRIDIRIDTGSQANATANNTRRALQAAGDLGEYDEVIIDISAMPRMVAMTTVAKVLHDLDRLSKTNGKNVNLHVTTAESIAIDRGAGKGSLSESVTTVAGFSGALSAQADEHHPRVWLPILGEGQAERLQLIKEKVDPDEICPVIPFPSREPRRGDEIIAEHRQILFDDFQIEPRNILHASEYNPFEAYKQLFLAIDHYREALGELGGCKAFVSPISSKLLSIGALLACYDHKFGEVRSEGLKVGMPYVETAAYNDPEIDQDCDIELYSMWLRGEWEK